MKISSQFPPNYADILKVFPDAPRYKAIFTYGDTCYNPWNIYIDPALEVHEETHVKQQYDNLGTDAVAQSWWNAYLKYPDFRLKEELQAYRAQYAYALENYTRDQRHKLLKHITTALSSSLYGNLISKKEARKAITNEHVY